MPSISSTNTVAKYSSAPPHKLPNGPAQTSIRTGSYGKPENVTMFGVTCL
jgi:hypothetical protein